MNVLKMTELPDGSVDMELEMTEEENNMFVEYAIVDILKKQIKRMEDEDE